MGCQGNQSFFGIKFCEQLLKRTSQGTFQLSLDQIGQAGLEEMFKGLLMPYDAQLTPGDPKSLPCAQVS